MITKYQGESLDYEVEVNNADGTPADLTGCSLAAGIAKINEGTVTRLTPTQAANVVTVSLSPETTAAMQGLYEIEIKIQDTSLGIGVAARDIIQIVTSLIPEFTPSA